jgi:hypothetical protein
LASNGTPAAFLLAVLTELIAERKDKMSQTHMQSRCPRQTSQHRQTALLSPSDVQDRLREMAFVLQATRRLADSILAQRRRATEQDEATLSELPVPVPC